MAMNISNGQEMKMTVASIDPLITTKNKTIRYLDPKAGNSTGKNLTDLAKELFANSQNSYKYTSGSIELGILSET